MDFSAGTAALVAIYCLLLPAHPAPGRGHPPADPRRAAAGVAA